jgi:uncharacterized protein (TIGR03083 family)
VSASKHIEVIVEKTNPVITGDLFPQERMALLRLLRELDDEKWHAPTACPDWSVKDVAAHVLGGDLGKLSRSRDQYVGQTPHMGEDLATFINRFNADWVRACRRLSPRILCDQLEISGGEIAEFFVSLDPHAIGEPVSWAGPDPAPVWLDMAREYTERWHHQQHIREAVGASGLTESRLMSPVIATFVRALPHSLREVEAEPTTAVRIHIDGESGGEWVVVREREKWCLYVGDVSPVAAHVAMDQDIAWRLFTNGVSREDVQKRVSIDGDPTLVETVLKAVAIIA